MNFLHDVYSSLDSLSTCCFFLDFLLQSCLLLNYRIRGWRFTVLSRTGPLEFTVEELGQHHSSGTFWPNAERNPECNSERNSERNSKHNPQSWKDSSCELAVCRFGKTNRRHLIQAFGLRNADKEERRAAEIAKKEQRTFDRFGRLVPHTKQCWCEFSGRVLERPLAGQKKINKNI